MSVAMNTPFAFLLLKMYIMIWYKQACLNILQLSFVFQMSVIPSVQPFHAIAYPLDPMLALEIRYEYYCL